ncbi:SYCN protein, partial [Furnarius figulus]|nr:SYCN protein [Furnarius figulus]
CPSAADLRPINGTRVCAQLYTDNSPYYDQCCAGDVLVVEPDSDVPYMPWKWSASVSSLVVGTRCELNVWSRRGKKGNTRRFSA